MAIKQTDIKLLWGRSGNRCAICQIELAFDEQHSSNSFPLGEQAHIVAKEPDGPRGVSLLSPEQRDSYPNLILLCPTDHTKIDKAPNDYPVERLYFIKAEHELWVQRRLGEVTNKDDRIAEEIYATLIDYVVEKCNLANWVNWTRRALELEPYWEGDAPDRYHQLAVKVQTAVWPNVHEELERALQTLSKVLLQATAVFLEHAECYNDHFLGLRFYKRLGEWNAERYEQLSNQWEEWHVRCHGLIFEATKAVNWFADCVRKYINPRFFATDGKFHLEPSLRSDISGLYMPEYSESERNALPTILSERFSSMQQLFMNEIS